MKDRIDKIRRKFGEFPLTVKFLISSVLVIFFVLIVLNVLIYFDFKNFFIAVDRKGFEKRFKKSLLSATSYYVFRNNWNENMDFSPILNILSNEPNLIEVIIFSPEGKRLSVLYNKNLLKNEVKSEGLSKALSGEISYSIKKVFDVESFGDIKIPEGTEYVQEIYYPVVFGGEVKGVVEIYKDFTEIMDNIDSVRYRASVFSLFGFIIYVLLLYYIVRKIDEKERALKEKVVYYEKLSILGQFASKMAHEIGTPMHVIMGNIDLIQEVYDDDFIKKRCDNIARQINKIQNIIRNYLYVSKKPEPSYESVRLKDLVSDILSDMSFMVSENISLKADVDDVVVFTDKGFVEQILYNFIKNSADSIGENVGSIKVKSKVDGDFVTIYVIDNGKGVDGKLKDKIFDPFFSTKKTGKGTGLGLAVCKELVEVLGGDIFCESKNGETIFGIKIPLKGKDA
ncbi:sensor histidine kinase [Deferribacter abyssi]|uniref:sensor histidine kinase n=1 Tax=Deferribacter abyssi TaxID=213806 RepID=UPI003C265F11